MIDEVKRQKALFLNSVYISLGVCILMIVIHLMVSILQVPKYNWSIYPRDIQQWYGIVTGQFIHSSWGHLLSNLAPLSVTIVMLFFFYKSISWAVFILILCLTGFSVFIFGRNLSHIGASGLVYGLISFMLFSGLFRRNIKSIVLASIMIIMYSGYTAGLVPTQPGVSWESHILGALSGLWTSFIFRNSREGDEIPVRYDWQGADRSPKDFFLERDTFEKTIAEREEEQRRLEQENKNIW
jgi:membrane associated rhomboid family serine protease